MNPFDITIVVIFGYCVILGCLRGIVREIAALIGVLGGFYLAFSFHGQFANILSPFIQNPYSRQTVGFLALFCAVAIGCALLGTVLRTFLRLIFLGVVDRIFGAVFGAAKAVVIISVLHLVLVTFLPSGGIAMMRDSRLAPAANAVAGVLFFVVPKQAKEGYVEKMERLRWKWEIKTEKPAR